ncbi:Ribosomal large subunit pseudouridine synthase D (23S rRNA pseudouridine(1911/1915/1917) synthase) (rRNA pseudouridylate synthase D) (rRNA-uridine isomerase D), partial [Durusdinium trenchii]
MASTGAAASPARPSGSQVISEVWKRLADGEQLTINERAILAWSLSMLPSSPLTPLAIQELQVQMVQVASQLRLEELLGEFAAAAFTVFWSSSFADSLSRSAAQAVWLAMWNALNLEPQLFPVEVVSWAKSSQVDPGMQIFPDQVVISKPPGWQVDYEEVAPPSDASSGRRLSELLRAVATPRRGAAPLPQNGFLHRLDVPSSGLILAARHVRAFYDLKMQLALGEIQRDYMVLGHGWIPSSRSVESAVHWLGRLSEKPSVVAYGKRARSRLKLLKHLVSPFNTTARGERSSCCSFVKVHIMTGRRHQIRLHMAFIGAPVVGDGKYAATPCYHEDLQWCGHHCLHRCRLSFSTSCFPGNFSRAVRVQVFEELPSNLKQFISDLRIVRDFEGK